SFDGRIPRDDAARDGGEEAAAPDDRHRRRRHVEDADQARDPMTGDVVQAGIGWGRLLRARLKQEDALVLIAAVDEYVASTLQVQAGGVVAARDEELHGTHGPSCGAGDVGAGRRVHAVRRIGQVAVRWSAWCWV